MYLQCMVLVPALLAVVNCTNLTAVLCSSADSDEVKSRFSLSDGLLAETSWKPSKHTLGQVQAGMYIPTLLGRLFTPTSA